MKKFLTEYTGGHPILLDDWRWLSAGISDSLVSTINAIVPLNVVTILTGCERTEDVTHVHFSAGFVSFSGEIHRVPAHSVLISTGIEHWQAITVFDPSGLKNFAEPGVSHDVYQEVIFKVEINAIPPVDATVFAETKKYVDYVTESIVKDTWKNVTSITIPPSGTFPGYYSINCYRDLDGFVHLRGKFPTPDDSGFGVVDILVGTLPLNYRPIIEFSCVVFNIQNSSTGELGSVFLTVQTNGQIKIKSLFTGFSGVFDYGQVPPFKAT